MDHALRVLEFASVLQALAERCESPLAADLALDLLPSFDANEVADRQAKTAEASSYLDSDTPPHLHAIRDLRREIERASKGGDLDGRSLYRVGEAMAAMRTLRTALFQRERFPALSAKAEFLVDAPALEDRLLRSLDSDGEVLDEASTELARLRKTKRNAASRLQDRLHAYLSGPNREYLSDAVVTQRAGRYVVPVKAEHRGKIRGLVHDTSASGQTLFVEPMDVLEVGNSLREAEAAEQAEVARILAELSSRVGAIGTELRRSLVEAGEIDLSLAMARLGHSWNGCLAATGPAASVKIEKGVHPLLDPAKAVPLTVSLGREGVDVLLITGPNTGGKTVSIKTVGLFVAMAQCGMMLPATHVEMGFFTQIWADVGDEQSLQQSLSTFSGHIRNIAEALTGLKPGALVLLDEVGAGTDPAEGAALAKAILLAAQRGGAKVMASTHYGELKVFASNTEGFLNSSMEFDLKTLRPTYKLLVGTPGASHALKIAERYGLPRSVIELASGMTGVSEQDVARMLEQLEAAQKRAIKAQSEADRLAHHLRLVEDQTEKKLAEAEEKSRTAKLRAAEALDEEMRRIRGEVADLIEDLKKGGNAQGARDKVRQMSERVEKLSGSLRPKQPERAPAKIEKGSVVKVIGTTQTGIVLEDPKGNQVRIQVGALKMTVKLNQLELAPNQPTAKVAPRKSHQLEKVQTASTEIHLRGMRAEDAIEMLDRFLDDSILAGLSTVRIVHGKGEGILRQIVHQTLQRHRGVKSHDEAEAGEGGAGVTIAQLR